MNSNDKLLHVAIIRDASNRGRVFAQIPFWSKGDEGLIPLTDLASISEYVKSMIHEDSLGSSRGQFINDLMNALDIFFHDRGSISFHGEEGLNKFKAVLKDYVDTDVFNEKNINFLEPTKVTISDASWKVERTFIRESGGIDRRSFSGTLEPFTILRMETLVLAEQGTIPEIGYAPGVEFMDKESRDLFMREVREERMKKNS